MYFNYDGHFKLFLFLTLSYKSETLIMVAIIAILAYVKVISL
jgi:hypothetical protein